MPFKEVLHIENTKGGSRIVFANDSYDAQKRAQNRDRIDKGVNSAAYKSDGKGKIGTEGRHYIYERNVNKK